MLAVLTFGLVALANPVTEKRQTDPLALVTSLQTELTGLTSQLRKTVHCLSNAHH